MWAFYRAESDQCASKLASLHDASAALRHQLHRKLGAAAAGEQSARDHAAGDTGGGPGDSSANATTTSLLDDPSLQYSSPVVVSTGGVLRPTPQVGFLELLGGAGGLGGGRGNWGGRCVEQGRGGGGRKQGCFVCSISSAGLSRLLRSEAVCSIAALSLSHFGQGGRASVFEARFGAGVRRQGETSPDLTDEGVMQGLHCSILSKRSYFHCLRVDGRQQTGTLAGQRECRRRQRGRRRRGRRRRREHPDPRPKVLRQQSDGSAGRRRGLPVVRVGLALYDANPSPRSSIGRRRQQY